MGGSRRREKRSGEEGRGERRDARNVEVRWAGEGVEGRGVRTGRCKDIWTCDRGLHPGEITAAGERQSAGTSGWSDTLGVVGLFV